MTPAYDLITNGFKSKVTGREYKYDPNYAPSRRRALSQLAYDNRIAEEARQSRLSKDARSSEQRVRDGAVVQGSNNERDVVGPLKRRIAELESKVKFAHGDKRRLLEQSIARLQDELDSQLRTAASAATQELRESDPRFQQAIRDGQAQLDRLQFRGDVDERLVNDSRQNLETLKETFDLEVFQRVAANIDAELASVRESQIAELRVKERELAEQLEQLRAEVIQT